MTKNKITLALAITAAIGISNQASAAGFQLAEYSATGLGRAFAGEAAMADNASAQFRNPAMLTYLKGIQISTGAIYVDPNIDIDGSHTLFGQTSTSDFANNAIIPNFYFSRPLTDKATIGIAFGTHFGMRTDLGTDFKASMFGNQAEVHTVEINPNLGYKINDQLSVGAGVRYVMASGHFGAASPITLPGMINKGQHLKYMEGEDNAWGWQAGTAWQINADNRIGISYQSAVKLNLEGHADGVAFDGFKNGRYAGTLPLELPASAEIASFHQLNDQWAVHASVNWTDWSSFEKLEANIPQLGGNHHIKNEYWKDNYRFAIGTTYQATNKLVLRSGVAYDTSAVDEANRTQTIPETDRTWLSVGAGYAWSENLTLDAGFTYIFAKEAKMVEQEQEMPMLGKFEGQTSGHIWLAGVQASYRF
ncbi:aromatic hydrocarbon degradation protein [Photobacterium iliopiscarium]|uniref:Aromatic hydrocarbon degradation protein n=1 Tax=Photobacterium iliopiscarium TaxID=56192 RepID=A0ABX5GV89_9GAMM|nr:outer membrane protein transport protein [Photobacterium iliopiscarium]KJG14893.1 aromatic hydrocarbon degradation protein [Photobacterium iliopiscarium]KJG23502.1 aromatic hydrocarbon degradation protein [Photobacterium iliopiscarium]PSU02064.1 aromatic hydrocarbon degradation protein [Photobacterium iliopiscarium]PSV84412.1 aromatic hydrocarbon degradation protein [Photobacterium iliopiscarium]PSW98692.1 aromatic hydrocarbon degradation protein [Photobacterium iliopiscarium]